MESMNLPAGSGERMSKLLARGLEKRSTKRRTRILLAGAASAVLVVGGTAGGAAIIMAIQQAQTRSAYCLDLGSQYTQVGLADQPYGPDGTVSVEPAGEDRESFAIDTCEATWRAGILPADNGRIPDLVACLRQDGVPAVFPSKAGEQPSDVCECVPRDPHVMIRRQRSTSCCASSTWAVPSSPGEFRDPQPVVS